MTSPRRRPARGVRRWTRATLAILTGTVFVVPLAATDGATAASLQAELNLTSFAPISVEDGKRRLAQLAADGNALLLETKQA